MRVQISSPPLTRHRLIGRTPLFHGGNMGSYPIGVINYFLLEGAVQVSVNYVKRKEGCAQTSFESIRNNSVERKGDRPHQKKII